MTTSKLIKKKLSVASTGAVCITAGFMAVAQAVTINSDSQDVVAQNESAIKEDFQTLDAPTIIDIGGPWYEFSFTSSDKLTSGCSVELGCVGSVAGNSIFVDSPPWQFTAPTTGATLKVTDAFFRGDIFDIFDFGEYLGSTSFVTLLEEELPKTSNPETAFTDSTYSSAAFKLAPGEHSITIALKQSPFELGAAYFRVDEDEIVEQPAYVPEPTSVISLLVLGMMGTGLALRKK